MAKLTDPVTHSEDLLGWWYQHQTEWLLQEADAIRNGLLQDLFALRRKLELLDGDHHLCLAETEHLYQALEQLGDRLSSPFVHDSLPLAMQHLLMPWRKKLPVQANMPTHWPAESAEHIRIVLSVLDYLLTSLGQMTQTPGQITISLAEAAEGKHLTLQIAFAEAVPLPLLTICETKDWLYRLLTFEVLTGGTTRHQYSDQTLEWQLLW